MDESHRGGSRGTLPWYYCCANPLQGQGTLGSHLVSEKKTHPKPQQVVPSRLCLSFGRGTGSRSLLAEWSFPQCRSPAPSKPTPPHPGPAASQAPRDSLTKERSQTALSRHAGSSCPEAPLSQKHRAGPAAPVPPGPSRPPLPALTAHGSPAAQPEAHGGQQRLLPHLASCRRTKVSARKIKFKKKNKKKNKVSKFFFWL